MACMVHHLWKNRGKKDGSGDEGVERGGRNGGAEGRIGKKVTYHLLISRKPVVSLTVSINRWYRNCSLAFISVEESMLPISLDVCNTAHHHFSTHQHHHCSPTSTIIALLTITILPTITFTAPPTSLTIAEVHYLVSSSTDTSQGKGIQTCLFQHQSCWLQSCVFSKQSDRISKSY